MKSGKTIGRFSKIWRMGYAYNIAGFPRACILWPGLKEPGWTGVINLGKLTLASATSNPSLPYTPLSAGNIWKHLMACNCLPSDLSKFTALFHSLVQYCCRLPIPEAPHHHRPRKLPAKSGQAVMSSSLSESLAKALLVCVPVIRYTVSRDRTTSSCRSPSNFHFLLLQPCQFKNEQTH